jgi:hypothetical protein
MQQRLEPAPLAHLLLTSPAWQRLGLAVPDPRFRERAANALARTIVDQLEGRGEPADEGQLTLAL